MDINDINDERLKEAVRQAEILRPPRQHLSTFGTTNIYYYLVAEPAYSDMVTDCAKTVIREGRVVAERPKIITPYYLTNVQGFSTDAKRYFEGLVHTHGPDAPGLFYTYRNEPKDLTIVSNELPAVVHQLDDELDRRGDPLTTIIKADPITATNR